MSGYFCIHINDYCPAMCNAVKCAQIPWEDCEKRKKK